MWNNDLTSAPLSKIEAEAVQLSNKPASERVAAANVLVAAMSKMDEQRARSVGFIARGLSGSAYPPHTKQYLAQRYT